MGCVRKQPQGEVLPPDPRRPQTAGEGSAGLGTDHRHPRPLSRLARKPVMRSIRAWLLRLRGMFGGAAADADLAAEFESHLQLHIDDNIRSGMTPAEAQRQARIALGGVEPTKERYRDRRGVPLLDTLRQDAIYDARMLRKNPGFTATAVITLALGIGAHTAIFSIVNAVLIRPLPFRDPARLAFVFGTDQRRGDRFDGTSYPAFLDWRRQNRSFEAMGAFANRSLTVATGVETTIVPGKRVTA